MGRREDRERALELLYEAGAKGVHPADVVDSLPVTTEPYAQLLAAGVGDHVDLLDHLIGARARGWAVDRLATVDRDLLRLGAFELAFEPEQPEELPPPGRRRGEDQVHRQPGRDRCGRRVSRAPGTRCRSRARPSARA